MITLGGISPAPGENSASINTEISFYIVDDNTGIDISSLVVILNGKKIIENNLFAAGYSGDISPSGSNYQIIIIPDENLEINKVYSTEVKVKNLGGRYSNNAFSFKTLTDFPVLEVSVPQNNNVFKFPQPLSLEFKDNFTDINTSTITVSINNLNYIEDGVVIPDYNGSQSAISIVPSIYPSYCKVVIDPKEALRNGKYRLNYIVKNISNKKLSGYIDFEVNKKEEVLPIIFPQIDFLGFFQGIKRVTNLGTGSSLKVEWNKPVKRTYQNIGYVLVYENIYRLNVFDTPKYIATGDALEATISGLKTGVTLSYGARAFELPAGILDPNGMMSADDNFYMVPEPIEIVSSVLPEDLAIPVSSTSGYPDSGLLFIDSEVISYTSVDRVNNVFNVPLGGRGLINSIPNAYFSGQSVRLFLECTDKNTVILMATPTYHDDVESNRYLKGEGVVVTDYTDNDRNVFDRYDYCGWRSARPQDTIYGKNDCGTYLGGEYNGFKGFNIYDRMLAQEEMLLETSGEPVIFLKRIWDGITCSCLNNRKMSPKVKSCQSCFGTGYEGGYIQYQYPRRNDRRILVSMKDAQEDLKYGEKEGLEQAFEPSCWTLAQPTIRDRDLIVRFDFTNDIEFIYEVLNVSRSKNFKRKFGKQEISLKRLDKTDIVYTYPFNLANIQKPS